MNFRSPAAARRIAPVACLVLLGLSSAWAHPRTGPAPTSDDVVIARVPVSVDNRERLLELAESHDVWGWNWRQGHAVIRTDRARLPADAVVDTERTARLHAPPARVRGGTVPGYPCYRTVEATHGAMQSLATDHPELVEVVDYGDSWEKTDGQTGYDLLGVVLTNENLPGPKPDLIIMAAIHAREMTTAETAMRFAEYLVDGHGSDADRTWLLDHNEIHILPQQNPDGRKLAEAGDYWRKNANDSYCLGGDGDYGADLNRNSSCSFWGDPYPSSSGDECDLRYRGTEPASEPETQAIEGYMADHFIDQRGEPLDVPAPQNTEGLFISLHSFSELVLYPWGGTDINSPNHAGLKALAQRMGYINDYVACQDCLYFAGGTTVDHAYETYGVAAFTYEMGTSFFQSCSAFENTIWPDNREALVHAAKSARRPYMTSMGPVVHGVSATPDGASVTLQADVDDDRYTPYSGGTGEPVTPSQPIAEVRYTVGQPPWQAAQSYPLDSVDGDFDSTMESAIGTVDASLLGGGRQLVYIYAVDAGGNEGPPTAVYAETLEFLFVDGFEP